VVDRMVLVLAGVERRSCRHGVSFWLLSRNARRGCRCPSAVVFDISAATLDNKPYDDFASPSNSCKDDCSTPSSKLRAHTAPPASPQTSPGAYTRRYELPMRRRVYAPVPTRAIVVRATAKALSRVG